MLILPPAETTLHKILNCIQLITKNLRLSEKGKYRLNQIKREKYKTEIKNWDACIF